MPDNGSFAPWYPQQDKIKKVIIENGVTNIVGYAFSGFSELTSITIPNSVMSIGEGAFKGTKWYDNQPDGLVYAGKVLYKYKGTMPSNTKIDIKEGTIGIAGGAFYNCSNLTSITIPNSVESIGINAFANSGITYINIPNSITSIESFVFEDCYYLTSITIPNSVTSIEDGAFEYCSNLTSINIPTSVTSIGTCAFRGCSELLSITIPKSVTSIGEYAFDETGWYENQPEGLVYLGSFLYKYKGTMPTNTKIKIKEGTKYIANNAFWNCETLTSVTIPNSVISIGKSVFERCRDLTSITVEAGNAIYDSRNNCNAIIETESNTLICGCMTTTIPNSVTSIGDYAFAGCLGLTSITIPNSVTSIGNFAFQSSSLTSITITNSVTSIGKGAFNASSIVSITIPNSVTSIEYGTFHSCIKLGSITIPNSVKKIEAMAFYGCRDLTSITIPNSVTSIEEMAFAGCYNLKSITIPNSVYNIGDQVFSSCSALTSITIPKSVNSIGWYAFNGCSNLISITCEAITPPNCISGEKYRTFYNVNRSIPIYVPANSVDAYKKANDWKDFTNIQAIPGTYTITDGKSYTNNSQLNGQDISYTRTFNNTSWQALYIPFSLNYEDWKDNFEIAYINGVRQLDKNDDGIIDETIMDVIKIKSGSTTPNMPYLIKAKKTGEKTFSVSNATLYPAEENSVDCSTTIAKYTFTGTYNAISSATMIANGYYAMGGGDLIQSDGSNDLKPYRWYMKVESRNPSYNASNAAKTITINVLDEESETTTGIEELQMTNYKSPVYDLNGRKVNENNLKPGIYVKNGKKFVVK